MRLVANRQLTGDYGFVAPGQEFWANDPEVAEQLIRRGLAAPVGYETKVIYPEAPQVAAREPFRFRPISTRDVPVPDDPEPPALAAVRDAVVQAADISKPGTVDPVVKRGRGRPPRHR